MIYILLLALCFLLIFLYEGIKRRRILRRLESRTSFTDDQLASQYGEDMRRAKLVVELRRMLAEMSALPVERLGMDDDDVFEIVGTLDSMGIVEFVLAVEKRYGVAIPDAKFRELVTLRELAEYIYLCLQSDD